MAARARGARALSTRDAHRRERMDDPAAPREQLHRTLDRFALVNRALAGTRRLYREQVRPRSALEPVRLLDIGAGGADIARHLLALAHRDRIALHVTAIDTDQRAVDWVRSRPGGLPVGLDVRRASTTHLRAVDERFDIVISNHLIHHLEPHEIRTLLDDSRALLRPGGVAVHHDIERSIGALRAFGVAAAVLHPLLLRGSWIRADGLVSIRRAYRADELRDIAGERWTVERRPPWRLELTARAGRRGGAS